LHGDCHTRLLSNASRTWNPHLLCPRMSAARMPRGKPALWTAPGGECL
jgi:hypothetical protein